MDQVVNPKVYSVFMPQIEDVVYKFLGIERPKAKEKNGACGLKDLLPKDLDPVSPESDKNSLKDLSLESLDTNDNLDEKQDDKGYNEQKLHDEAYMDRDKTTSENGHISSEEKTSDEVCKTFNKIGSNTNLNVSGKSDDKMDEEEEDSPTFEPIDIMNLNESNISNDSHLSGISELTSHRSRSPDFSNDLSRDNFDCSNHDSQLSKVSSDSRLSIVTDFGSSNHALTPVHDAPKDEVTKDKYEAKNSSKDNFRAIREFDSSKNKTSKNNFELVKSKDTQDYKESKDFKSTKSLSSRESSRDATDSSVKDKYEHKSSRERSKDSESVKSRSAKEKISSKDTKYYKDRSSDKKKASSSHSNIKYDKHSKGKDSKPKDKIDQAREGSEKPKDISENLKDNANRLKDEKLKETDKKDNVSKEAKDLKDLYKEKIRELREKKELTEKEKLNKDKDKLNKETKDRKDSLKDRKSSKKEHKSSSSSSLSKSLSVNYHESKSGKTSVERVADGKDKKLDSKDKARRDEKRLSKDGKSKTHFSSKTDLSDKSDKSDVKKISRSEKEDKLIKVDTRKDVRASSEKTNGKKDARNHLQSKSSDRNEKKNGKKDAKGDSQSKDKKRREDKRSKVKDDHSSLRKSSNDRRSTDRDGSNGSNSKTSQSNNSNSNMTSQKAGSSNLTKENQVSNSSSETSDSIEEMQSLHQSHHHCFHKTGSQQLSTSDKSYPKIEIDNSDETQKQEEVDPHRTNLPSQKRPIEEDENSSELKIKKPKFAKNIHEAKKLMKIRKQMEKQKVKDDRKTETRVTQETEQTSQPSTTRDADNLASMPDDERVQIIEVSDEEYEEPYPEKECSLTLDERSIIMLGAEPCTGDFLNSHCNPKANLSSIELCIRESLNEMVSNMPLGEAVARNLKSHENSTQFDANSCQQASFSCAVFSETDVEDMKNLHATREERKDDSEASFKDETLKDAATEQVLSDNPQIEKMHVLQNQKGEREIALKESESTVRNENESTESTKMRDCERPETYCDDNKEAPGDKRIEVGRDNDETESHNEKQAETPLKVDAMDSHSEYERIGPLSSVDPSEDNEDCRYFKTDNERSERFSSFLEKESLELVESSSLEDIIEILGGKVVTSVPKSMAPPLSKPKRSSSPLSDILVNNNNDGHKRSSPNEDTVHRVKKRKLLTAKKPRFPSFCNAQGISNGENFVMPLSPDSDVSATSEKTSSSNVIKEEKRYVLGILYAILRSVCSNSYTIDLTIRVYRNISEKLLSRSLSA